MQIKLKAARVNAGYTQSEAADLLNIGRTTIQNYESYKTKPSIELATKMAELYGLTVNDIIFLTTNCA